MRAGVLAAAVILLLPARGALSCGERGPAAGRDAVLHWALPRQLPPTAVTRYGQPAAPCDLIEVDGTLLASTFGQVAFFMLPPEGAWVELGSESEATAVSRWAGLEGRAVALVGSRAGVVAKVVRPGRAVAEVLSSHDVHLPKEAAGPMFSHRSYLNIYATDLMAAGKKLYALYILGDPQAIDPSARTQVLLRTSADGGESWSEPQVLAGADTSRSPAGASAALWEAGGRLHAAYALPGARPVHKVSGDEGATWQDGPGLAKPEEGKDVSALRAWRGDGAGALLLAVTGSPGDELWLCRGSEDGELKAPRRVTAVKGDAGHLLMTGHHLAASGKTVAAGIGFVKAKHSRDQKTGQTRSSWAAQGELLISRDGGETWERESFTAGIAGKAFSPRASLRADGGIDLLFGWVDSSSGAAGLLYRRASPRPPPGMDPDTAASLTRMIADLAAEDYRVREAAWAGLRSLGMLALPELRKAAGSKDPERSLAAETLLKRMTPPWWKVP